MILLVAVASGADVLWYAGNGGDDRAEISLLEGNLAVEATSTWPASLAGYRLVFLAMPDEYFDTSQVSSLGETTSVLLGEYGSYTEHGTDTLNTLLNDLSLETRFDGVDLDCVTERRATSTEDSLSVGSPAYICSDSLTLGSSGSAIYLGESGQVIAAEEAGVVMLADSNLLVEDITLNADNRAFLLNLYVATCGVVDLDGDGFDAALCGGDDCDDGDAAVNVGAAERCNDEDDDCDGEVDEAGADGELTWYRDGDGDGVGDDGEATASCSAPPGFVPSGGDCDDGNAAIRPGADEHCDGRDEDCDGLIDDDPVNPRTWYLDADLDSSGSTTAVQACLAPYGYCASNDDCDDTNRFVHPGADEHCDGRDEDCDGSVDELAVDAPTAYSDYDHDGVGGGDFTIVQCDVPAGYALVDGDCDDHDEARYPGADEVCDEVDNDCDEVVDEDAVDADAWYADVDDDGWGDTTQVTYACARPSETTTRSGDCDDADPDLNPGELELCDGIDQDCDHAIDDDVEVVPWYEDKDGDGLGVQKHPVIACAQPEGYVAAYGDCDDQDPTRTLDCTADPKTPREEKEAPRGCGCAAVPGVSMPFFLVFLLRRR